MARRFAGNHRFSKATTRPDKSGIFQLTRTSAAAGKNYQFIYHLSAVVCRRILPASVYIKPEKSVEIAEEDEGVIIKGSLDTLVLKDRLWLMVIEAKRASFSIEAGLPQILAYMLANPEPEHVTYGAIATGGSFIFVKLVNGESPRYATSKGYLTRNPGNELYDVLRILKRLTQIVISQ
jgi:hypothetical protein